MKKIFLAGFLLALTACHNGTNEPSSGAKKLLVVASFYPLAHFSEIVGGSLVKVTTIVPAGVEPHEFEPTPRDIEEIFASGVLVLNGAGLEPWAEKVLPEAQKRGVHVLVVAEKIPSRIEGERPNPHFWLDPKIAEREVEFLRDAFSQKDPAHAAAFKENADRFIAQLEALDKEYQKMLAGCKTDQPVIVSHDAYAYLAARYGLTFVPIAGLSPEEEPSPRTLAELVSFARTYKVKYVFFETLASKQLAETIARETGAQTAVLNPVEGLTQEEAAAHEDYLSIMRKNLQNVRQAYECTH